MPSVTKAHTPWFFAMPTSTSPTTLASSYASVAMTITSPGRAYWIAAYGARLSRGRLCTVSATPQKRFARVIGCTR